MDFILSHFEGQHELFPRTIMTSRIGRQEKIEYESDVQKSKDKIFNYFNQSSFVDCKINAFPYNTEHTAVDLQVKNRTAASFIMIDLDLKDFVDKEKLDKQWKKTLKMMDLKFNEKCHPTVLWTGNGYHIYQPIEGLIFEKEKVFYDFLPYVDGKDLTTEFLRFVKNLFTKGKADPNHRPSIKSCLVRVPGTVNSKNGQQVRIIQRWDGKRPSIQRIAHDFRDYLIQKRIDKIVEKRKRSLSKRQTQNHDGQTNKIEWIERLLQTPIKDGRKQCLWRILCPYLINIRKLTKEGASILIEWLENCSKVRAIDFNSQRKTKDLLDNVGHFLPLSINTLKERYTELYRILKANDIIVD